MRTQPVVATGKQGCDDPARRTAHQAEEEARSDPSVPLTNQRSNDSAPECPRKGGDQDRAEARNAKLVKYGPYRSKEQLPA
jgi:hypothetical protein